MRMTMTEKILARASGSSSVKPGDVAVVTVETAVLMDMTFLPESWREILKVHDASKVVVVFDHLSPAPTVQAADAQRIGRGFALKFGITRLHDIGRDQGICHAVVADRAYAVPGTVLVNGDSHTCAAGAFNCAARGVGAPDMLYAVTTGKAWFRVGETVRYDFSGKLPDGVSAKDIFLTIAGKYGAHQPEHRIRRTGPVDAQHQRAAHAGHHGHRTLGRVRHLRSRRRAGGLCP
jgi:3-isopropylmalate/(R)-2-methylmalate dehydratase large subunit